MPLSKAAFVLVHGGWHNHSTWDKVVPMLEAQGFAPLTLDLPGAGVNAIAPKSLRLRPFDLTAFATERSPVAGVTQSERTQAVVALVREAASLGNGKVVLVGHSAGGLTISAVAEQVPDLLLAVVYVSGFMLPNGMQLFALLQHGSMASSLVFDATRTMERPAHFVLIAWRSDRIIAIRDFLFAAYALEAVDWVRLG
jgi:pimeloyl-ACP methyl ester carboxylesterase